MLRCFFVKWFVTDYEGYYLLNMDEEDWKRLDSILNAQLTHVHYFVEYSNSYEIGDFARDLVHNYFGLDIVECRI